MWKSAYVGVYQLLNWKMHGETLKIKKKKWCFNFHENIMLQTQIAHQLSVFRHTLVS